MSLKQIFLKAPYKVQNSQNIGVCGSVLTCKMHCLGNDDVITSICACPLLFCVISMRLRNGNNNNNNNNSDGLLICLHLVSSNVISLLTLLNLILGLQLNLAFSADLDHFI